MTIPFLNSEMIDEPVIHIGSHRNININTKTMKDAKEDQDKSDVNSNVK